MANVITDITPDPTTVAADGKSTLKITYLADTDGSVQFTNASGEFKLHPTTADLSAQPTGPTSVEMVVTRVIAGAKRCDIQASFAGSIIHTWVMVN